MKNLPERIHYIPTKKFPNWCGIITGNEEIEIVDSAINFVFSQTFGDRATEIPTDIIKFLANPEEQTLYHEFTCELDLENGGIYQHPFCISKEEDKLIVFLSLGDDSFNQE